MDEAANILVILLSVVLLFFLTLLSFLIILLIRISRQIKQIADEAERSTGSVSVLIASFGRFTKPVIAAKIIIGLLTKLRKGDSHGKRK